MFYIRITAWAGISILFYTLFKQGLCRICEIEIVGSWWAGGTERLRALQSLPPFLFVRLNVVCNLRSPPYHSKENSSQTSLPNK